MIIVINFFTKNQPKAISFHYISEITGDDEAKEV